MTWTSEKYFKTAHCIVNLYKSVSKKEITPSGKGEDPLKSMSVMLFGTEVKMRAVRRMVRPGYRGIESKSSSHIGGVF